MRAIITVIGKDRVGIIASVTRLLADQNVNILDITQTILSDFFTMVMLTDVGHCALPFDELAAMLSKEGSGMGLTIQAQREDIFNVMHRI